MSLAICSAALVRALVARFLWPSCFATRLHPLTARKAIGLPLPKSSFTPKKYRRGRLVKISHQTKTAFQGVLLL